MKGRAVYAVEEGRVELREFDIDEGALGPEQVLTKTHYSIISAGTELDCISGVESSWFHFPQQLGYCAVGEVLATLLVMLTVTAAFLPPCLMVPATLVMLGGHITAAVQTFSGKDFRYPWLGEWLEKRLAQ